MKIIKSCLILFLAIGFSTQIFSQVKFIKSSQLFEIKRTNHIAVEDFDNDGDQDIALANMGLNYSQILLNDGNGIFTDSGQKLTQMGHGIKAVDFDNDGDLDLFFTSAGWTENGVEHKRPSKIYLNDGRGIFTDSGQEFGDSLLSGNGINVIDIDCDGDYDIHIFYFDVSDYKHFHKVYLNAGDGNYELSDIKFNKGDRLNWRDINNDEKIDVVIKNDGWLKSFINKGGGEFVEVCSINDDNILIRGDVAFLDTDNDSDLDLIVANGNRRNSDSTLIFLNKGDGVFYKSAQKLPPVKAGRIGVGDINNDGAADFILTSFGLPNQIWINDGKGVFRKGQSFESERTFHSPTFSDLDNDGDLDLIIANYLGGANEIWFNELNKKTPQ